MKRQKYFLACPRVCNVCLADRQLNDHDVHKWVDKERLQQEGERVGKEDLSRRRYDSRESVVTGLSLYCTVHLIRALP